MCTDEIWYKKTATTTVMTSSALNIIDSKPLKFFNNYFWLTPKVVPRNTNYYLNKMTDRKPKLPAVFF